jgi:GNAT superfamily N-acetyltransferase
MEGLVGELEQEIAETGDVSGVMTLEPVKTYEGIRDCVMECYAVVAEHDDRIVGSLGLGSQAFWYSSVQHLWNAWYFVEPEYRNSRAGAMMLREVKNFARMVRMPLIVGISSLKDVDRKDAFFKRLFRPIGGWYLQVVKDE